MRCPSCGSVVIVGSPECIVCHAPLAPPDRTPQGAPIPPPPGDHGQPYPGQTYPGQTYPGQPYPGQPYPGQPYPGQPYPGQPYPGQPYPGQTGYGYPGHPPPHGYPPPPGTVPPGYLPPGTAPRRRRRWPLLVAVLAVMAVAAGAVAFVLTRDQGPSHPDEWDTRVASIADYVAAERGLEFDHPVYVDFLTPEEYRAVTTGSEDPEASHAEEAEQATADEDFSKAMRAVGLLSGKVDLEAVGDELADTGTVAHYDADAERIRVRGTEVTPALEVTLAHELTHALQDQHFDLDRVYELDATRAGTLRAVVEGDATVIELAYTEDRLDEEELAEYEAQSAETAEAATEELDETVPDVFLQLFAAPYELGYPLVELVRELDGRSAVDDLLITPPLSDEQLFDPFAYLEDDVPLGPPGLPELEGAELLDQDTFGSIALYLMLATRIDPVVALRASDAWGSDVTRISRTSSGRICVDLSLLADEGEAGVLEDALARWAAAMPDEAGTTVTTTGDVHAVRTCDPGEDGPAVPDANGSALVLPAFRSAIAMEVVRDGGLDEEQAKCVANAFAGIVTIEQIEAGAEALGSDPATQQALQQAVVGCR